MNNIQMQSKEREESKFIWNDPACVLGILKSDTKIGKLKEENVKIYLGSFDIQLIKDMIKLAETIAPNEDSIKIHAEGIDLRDLRLSPATIGRVCAAPRWDDEER